MVRTRQKKEYAPHTSLRVQIYQDESGMKGSDPFLILGFLLMEATVGKQLERRLGSIATFESVVGEVHFCKLSKDVTGSLGAKFRVTEAWLRELRRFLTIGTERLTILAVDKKKIDRKKVPEAYMLYNRFSRMGMDSTLARFARSLGMGSVRVTVHCDEHCLKGAAAGHPGDNYSQYLRKQLRASFNKKSEEKHRQVALRGVRVHLEDSQESRVLQLVDAVLGAMRQHIMNDASRVSKISLGQQVGAWLSDSSTGVIPFARFSAQRFPGDTGSRNGSHFSPLT